MSIRGRGTSAVRCSRWAAVRRGVITPWYLRGSRRTSQAQDPGQGLPAPTSPSYQMGSNDTTVPVWAAWMIVFAP